MNGDNSKQLINRFIKAELEQFKRQFYALSVPEIQDVRSLAIAWACYYFKEFIESDTSSAIVEFVDEIHARDDYSTYCWFKISALQAAAFLLTSEVYYANSLIRHISCEQGWARYFILQSASIICPLLSFNDMHLKKATEFNIEHSHGYYEENIVLYLSTKGSSAEKRNWLEHQIAIVETDYHKRFYMELKTAGKRYASGFFVEIFNKLKSYLIFKIMTQPSVGGTQLSLFDKSEFDFVKRANKETQLTLFDRSESGFVKFAKMEQAHPLNNYYIDLSFLKDDPNVTLAH